MLPRAQTIKARYTSLHKAASGLQDVSRHRGRSAEILRRLTPILDGVRRLAASFQYGGLVRQGLMLAIRRSAVRHAGVRESSDLVESLEIERTWQAMADADLTLVVLDVSQPTSNEDESLIACAASSRLTGAGIPELRWAILNAVSPARGLERKPA